MKFILKKGETSVILLVYIQDSSATDGSGLGSLDENSSIVGGYCKRNGTGVALAVDENVTTEGTYQTPSTAAHVRIGTPANMRTGWYELHFHNDLFTSADYVGIGLGGASNMAELPIEIQLTDFDLNDGVRGALTALPNAVPAANGGLPTVDSNNRIAGIQGTKNDFDDLNDIDGSGLATEAKQDVIDANVDTILEDTGSTLPAQITSENATLSGQISDVETDTQDIQTQIGTAGAGLTDLGGMSDSMKTEVNDEVLDVMNVDTFTEPGQEASPDEPTMREMMHYNYKGFTNKTEQTATTHKIYNRAGDTVDHQSTDSDDGNTATLGKLGAGS